MDIQNIVSTDYTELSPETPVSKLVGVFDDPAVKGVVVHGDEFEGVVTRRQLATSHHQPNEKLRSLRWHVPRLAPDEDIRTAARLMLDSDSQLLPVFDGPELIGVVTAEDLLQAVRPFLDAVTVADAYTPEMVTVEPGTSFGTALNVFREHRITHLPVVDGDTAVGILSLYDVTGLTVRATTQSQGGDPGGTDPFGGDIAAGSGRARGGGFGARDGELTRLLDLPVRDLMIEPVRTIQPTATLDVALDAMTEIDASSLLVTDDGSPYGIVTKTDILDSLTWEAGGNRSVQLYGADLLDDIQYEEIVAMIDKFDDRDHDMNILDAKIHMHEHDEKHRGTPLLLARIRLHTDRGLFVASGEGYGASHALNEARDVMERQIRDEKTYGRSKKPRGEEFWEKRFGWLLEGDG
ncbi:CBS domain-containing protein [Haloarcula pelagica]|uniref:CBS domain-containing protein n=1 Tax=Haloarcula pelagica TaxID=3033389 RepID=UPI0024C3A03E|nr:CBS domain-containing protein [Halomicroarcula sp. YJ-61-S]